MKHVAPLLLSAALALSTFPALAQDDAATCDTGVNYVQRAESALLEDQFDAAIDAYTCLIEDDADNAEAYMGRAVAALKLAALEGDFSHNISSDLQVVYDADYNLFSETIEQLSADLDENPEDIGTLAARGYLNFYVYNTDQAMDDYNEIIVLDRENAFGYLYRGGANQYQGNTAKAAADYARAIRFAGDNADVYGSVGANYLNNSQYELAIEHFDRAIELNPERATFWADRGYARTQLEDYEGAVEDYGMAIELAPENPDNYANRAYAYELLEEYENAVADYSHAIELDAEYQYGYYARGWDYIALEDWAAAVSDFNIAIRMDPADRWSYLGRATAAHEIGDVQAAAEDYAVYVELMESTSEEAGMLGSGDTETVEMAEGTVVRFDVFADEGDTLTITAVSPDTLVDTLVLLNGPDGDPLVGSDDAEVNGDSLDAAITEFVVPEDGQYELIVTHAGAGSYGEVDVTLEVEK